MMQRAGYLLGCMAIALWPVPASAQPLFRCEHNWTVTAGEQVYGLRQVLQIPGNSRWTQVWLGRCTFDMRCRNEEVIALLLLPPGDLALRFSCLVDWKSFRRLQ
jgi:hypothetical protein